MNCSILEYLCKFKNTYIHTYIKSNSTYFSGWIGIIIQFLFVILMRLLIFREFGSIFFLISSLKFIFKLCSLRCSSFQMCLCSWQTFEYIILIAYTALLPGIITCFSFLSSLVPIILSSGTLVLWIRLFSFISVILHWLSKKTFSSIIPWVIYLGVAFGIKTNFLKEFLMLCSSNSLFLPVCMSYS